MFLTFGEIMMRVAPAAHLRLRQVLPGQVDVTFAGAEANVAVALAMWGQPVRYLTALAKNPLAEVVLAHLRGFGVDVNHVLRRDEGRLGIYFVETGANQRSSTVIYDRDGSAISQAEFQEYDLEAALGGVTWVHVTGITPSLSEQAFRATLSVVRRARERGATVSCDLNFRAKLWRWSRGKKPRELARECMQQIVEHADLLIANEEDAHDVFGFQAEGTSIEGGRINARAYESVAQALADRFPNLQRVAITLRESFSADYNHWGAMLYDVARRVGHLAPSGADGQYQPYEIRDIVDRVGAGDAFGAGLLYALTAQAAQGDQAALQFAVAASCLKHSIKSDFNYVTLEEVRALVAGQASGRVRR